MWPEWVELLAVFLVFVAVIRVVHQRPPLSRALVRVAARSWEQARRRLGRTPPPQPPGRPLELIVSDVRRLGPRFQHPPRGTSFAKLEGLRHAYDRALTEACTALGIEHLLGVLPPGDELDAERARVENLLWLAGLRIDEAA